ncbi:hypothetical protein NRB36_004307 [Salmonella enterica]|nr:hypothetical protein [Salmonella enterica]EJO1639666.1 hypothetical protein [Salmonella enterica]
MKQNRTAAAAALALALTAGAAHAGTIQTGNTTTFTDVCGDHVVQVTLKDSVINNALVDDVQAENVDVLHTVDAGKVVAMFPIIMTGYHQHTARGYMLTVESNRTTLIPFSMEKDQAGKWGQFKATGYTLPCHG